MKNRQSQLRARSRSSVGEAVIVFAVQGFTFAIATNAVDEIRECEGLHDFSFGGSHHRLARISQTFERKGRRYFVIDGASHFKLGTGRPSRLLVLRHVRGALAVDSIDRMQEIQSVHPLPVAFLGEERQWYRGLALIKGKVVPVIRPEAVLSNAEESLLQASVQVADTPARKRRAVTA